MQERKVDFDNSIDSENENITSDIDTLFGVGSFLALQNMFTKFHESSDISNFKNALKLLNQEIKNYHKRIISLILQIYEFPDNTLKPILDEISNSNQNPIAVLGKKIDEENENELLIYHKELIEFINKKRFLMDSNSMKFSISIAEIILRNLFLQVEPNQNLHSKTFMANLTDPSNSQNLRIVLLNILPIFYFINVFNNISKLSKIKDFPIDVDMRKKINDLLYVYKKSLHILYSNDIHTPYKNYLYFRIIETISHISDIGNNCKELQAFERSCYLAQSTELFTGSNWNKEKTNTLISILLTPKLFSEDSSLMNLERSRTESFPIGFMKAYLLIIKNIQDDIYNNGENFEQSFVENIQPLLICYGILTQLSKAYLQEKEISSLLLQAVVKIKSLLNFLKKSPDVVQSIFQNIEINLLNNQNLKSSEDINNWLFAMANGTYTVWFDYKWLGKINETTMSNPVNQINLIKCILHKIQLINRTRNSNLSDDFLKESITNLTKDQLIIHLKEYNKELKIIINLNIEETLRNLEQLENGLDRVQFELELYIILSRYVSLTCIINDNSELNQLMREIFSFFEQALSRCFKNEIYRHFLLKHKALEKFKDYVEISNLSKLLDSNTLNNEKLSTVINRPIKSTKNSLNPNENKQVRSTESKALPESLQIKNSFMFDTSSSCPFYHTWMKLLGNTLSDDVFNQYLKRLVYKINRSCHDNQTVEQFIIEFDKNKKLFKNKIIDDLKIINANLTPIKIREFFNNMLDKEEPQVIFSTLAEDIENYIIITELIKYLKKNTDTYSLVKHLKDFLTNYEEVFQSLSKDEKFAFYFLRNPFYLSYLSKFNQIQLLKNILNKMYCKHYLYQISQLSERPYHFIWDMTKTTIICDQIRNSPIFNFLLPLPEGINKNDLLSFLRYFLINFNVDIDLKKFNEIAIKDFLNFYAVLANLRDQCDGFEKIVLLSENCNFTLEKNTLYFKRESNSNDKLAIFYQGNNLNVEPLIYENNQLVEFDRGLVIQLFSHIKDPNLPFSLENFNLSLFYKILYKNQFILPKQLFLTEETIGVLDKVISQMKDLIKKIESSNMLSNALIKTLTQYYQYSTNVSLVLRDFSSSQNRMKLDTVFNELLADIKAEDISLTLSNFDEIRTKEKIEIFKKAIKKLNLPANHGQGQIINKALNDLNIKIEGIKKTNEENRRIQSEKLNELKKNRANNQREKHNDKIRQLQIQELQIQEEDTQKKLLEEKEKEEERLEKEKLQEELDRVNRELERISKEEQTREENKKNKEKNKRKQNRKKLLKTAMRKANNEEENPKENVVEDKPQIEEKPKSLSINSEPVSEASQNNLVRENIDSFVAIKQKLINKIELFSKVNLDRCDLTQFQNVLKGLKEHCKDVNPEKTSKFISPHNYVTLMTLWIIEIGNLIEKLSQLPLDVDSKELLFALQNSYFPVNPLKEKETESINLFKEMIKIGTEDFPSFFTGHYLQGTQEAIGLFGQFKEVPRADFDFVSEFKGQLDIITFTTIINKIKDQLKIKCEIKRGFDASIHIECTIREKDKPYTFDWVISRSDYSHHFPFAMAKKNIETGTVFYPTALTLETLFRLSEFDPSSNLLIEKDDVSKREFLSHSMLVALLWRSLAKIRRYNTQCYYEIFNESVGLLCQSRFDRNVFCQTDHKNDFTKPLKLFALFQKKSLDLYGFHLAAMEYNLFKLFAIDKSNANVYMEKHKAYLQSLQSALEILDFSAPGSTKEQAGQLSNIAYIAILIAISTLFIKDQETHLINILLDFNLDRLLHDRARDLINKVKVDINNLKEGIDKNKNSLIELFLKHLKSPNFIPRSYSEPYKQASENPRISRSQSEHSTIFTQTNTTVTTVTTSTVTTSTPTISTSSTSNNSIYTSNSTLFSSNYSGYSGLELPNWGQPQGHPSGKKPT